LPDLPTPAALAAALIRRYKHRGLLMKNSKWLLFVVVMFVASTNFASAQPPRRPGQFGMDSSSSLEKPPLAANDAEQKILAALAEMAKGEWYANVSPTDGRILRQLTEATGAKRVVEIGTSSGYSGIWFALALRNTGGHLWTHEIDPERIKLATENFKKAGVEELITIVPGDAHETVKQHTEPIDILFLDADKPGYVDYLEKLLPLVRPGGLILAHNMRQPEPDPRYLEAITTDPNLETTFLLMQGAGIGVTLKKCDAAKD
jgi:predicted O-methyltransferase YrrM